MRTRTLVLLGLVPLMLAIASCGGGGGAGVTTGSGSSGGGETNNVATMIVDAGPSPNGTSVNSVDIPYTTVTICYPGSTAQCQTFDNIEVDTGSYGLRILADATDTSGNPLSINLPAETDSSGNTIAECTQFVDGYSWGPVATADIDISGESAASVPIQVIGDPSQSGESSFPPVPSNCSGTGSQEDTVATFGANGILGVGPFTHDCGAGCSTGSNAANNGVYYTCPASGASCVGAAVDTTEQVTNPVADFQTDNNGVIIELPAISSGGEPTVTGSLVFGIDTEGDNALNAQTVLTADADGDVTTDFNGQSLPYSLFDTGSNAYYFNDAQIPPCTSSNLSGGWFCPSSTVTLGATNYGVSSSGTMTGTSSPVTLYIGNASTLFNGDSAYNDIGASAGDQTAICGSSDCSFDFGLPFFFGRDVYVAISGADTSAGYGPFYAY